MAEHFGKFFMKKRDRHTSLNSLTWMWNSGNVHRERGTYCFAPIKAVLRADSIENKGLKRLILSPAQGKNNKTFNKYLDFILNRSIFKDCFLTKRVCDAYQYGIEMDLSKPGNQTWAAMTSVRRGWEYPYKTNAWKTLVDNGISENFALILSPFLQREKGKKELLSSLTIGESGHEAFYFQDIGEGIASLLNPLKKITAPLFEGIISPYQIFRTTQFPYNPIKNEEWLVWKKRPRNSWDLGVVNLEATVENLKRIQKEYNV